MHGVGKRFLAYWGGKEMEQLPEMGWWRFAAGKKVEKGIPQIPIFQLNSCDNLI